MSGYQVIAPELAKDLLDQPALMVLDMRDHRSYRAGHIEGALLLHDGLFQSIVEREEWQRPLLVYCYRGNTSLEKAALFAELGFAHVYSLEGGFTAWSKAHAGA
jgi:rhodanese-related sulfurtransferase